MTVQHDVIYCQITICASMIDLFSYSYIVFFFHSFSPEYIHFTQPMHNNSGEPLKSTTTTTKEEHAYMDSYIRIRPNHVNNHVIFLHRHRHALMLPCWFLLDKKNLYTFSFIHSILWFSHSIVYSFIHSFLYSFYRMRHKSTTNFCLIW